MIIIQPRKENRFIQICSRAITDGVTTPSQKVKLAINGLIYRHTRSGFMLDREMYYNFRHDGAEAFSYYNYALPAGPKISKIGTVTHVANSHITFQGTTGLYNTNRALGLDVIYGRFHNSHHVGIKVMGGYIIGVNVSGAGYTMLDSGVGIRIHCASTEGDIPASFPWNVDGHYFFGRTDASNIYAGKNGVRDAVMAQPDNGFSLAGISLYIGGRNANGAADGTAGGQIRYYSNGEVTTSTRDAQVYNAEADFQNCLSVLP